MPPVRMQLEGPSLEELLGQVQREHGDSARIVQAEKIRTGGVGGFFARERYQIDLELDEQAPEQDRPAASSLLELADRVDDDLAVVSRAEAQVPQLSTQTQSFSEVLASLQREGAPADQADGRPRTTAAASPPPDADQLRLLAWLGSLPSVPPPTYAPGQVLAVVGEAEPALRVATSLAEALGTDPEAVLLATPSARSRRLPSRRRLCDPAEMATRRNRWARQPYGTIVAVEAPMLLRPEGWARSALSALAPSFVWGAVAATTKVADVEAWAQRIGRVDALAVAGLEATLDPASLLTSTIPVALVDGRRSTPHLWAALLAERMAP